MEFVTNIFLKKNVSCGEISDFYAWQIWRNLKHVGKDNRFESIWRVDFPRGASYKSDLPAGAFNGPDLNF